MNDRQAAVLCTNVMKWTVVFVLVCSGCACTKGDSFASRPACGDTSSDEFFFPAGSLGSPAGSEDDAFRRRLYSESLRAMSEPSLSCKEPTGEVYRFLRVNGKGSSVRVAEHEGVVSLSGVDLPSPFYPHEIVETRRVEKSLTAGQWATVLEAVKAIEFWSMPSRDPEGSGADGEEWIIEGRRGRRYHAVNRWSPRGGPIQRWLNLRNWAGFTP